MMDTFSRSSSSILKRPFTNRLVVVLTIVAVSLAVLFAVGCGSQGSGLGQGAGQGIGQGQGVQQQLDSEDHSEDHIVLSDFPVEEVSLEEFEALSAALDDERKARATYEGVLIKFGDVNPFSNILSSEEMHISYLLDLYKRYDIVVPEDTWAANAQEFDSVEDACAAGVQAEIENAALYDALFAKVDNQDIIAVFTALRDASEQKHLPAFKRCGGAR